MARDKIIPGLPGVGTDTDAAAAIINDIGEDVDQVIIEVNNLSASSHTHPPSAKAIADALTETPPPVSSVTAAQSTANSALSIANGKQDPLVPGDNITINPDGKTINATNQVWYGKSTSQGSDQNKTVTTEKAGFAITPNCILVVDADNNNTAMQPAISIAASTEPALPIRYYGGDINPVLFNKGTHIFQHVTDSGNGDYWNMITYEIQYKIRNIERQQGVRIIVAYGEWDILAVMLPGSGLRANHTDYLGVPGETWIIYYYGQRDPAQDMPFTHFGITNGTDPADYRAIVKWAGSATTPASINTQKNKMYTFIFTEFGGDWLWLNNPDYDTLEDHEQRIAALETGGGTTGLTRTTSEVLTTIDYPPGTYNFNTANISGNASVGDYLYTTWTETGFQGVYVATYALTNVTPTISTGTRFNYKLIVSRNTMYTTATVSAGSEIITVNVSQYAGYIPQIGDKIVFTTSAAMTHSTVGTNPPGIVRINVAGQLSYLYNYPSGTASRSHYFARGAYTVMWAGSNWIFLDHWLYQGALKAQGYSYLNKHTVGIYNCNIPLAPTGMLASGNKRLISLTVNTNLLIDNTTGYVENTVAEFEVWIITGATLYSITWWSGISWQGGAPPILAANQTLVCTFQFVAANKYIEISRRTFV